MSDGINKSFVSVGKRWCAMSALVVVVLANFKQHTAKAETRKRTPATTPAQAYLDELRAIQNLDVDAAVELWEVPEDDRRTFRLSIVRAAISQTRLLYAIEYRFGRDAASRIADAISVHDWLADIKCSDADWLVRDTEPMFARPISDVNLHLPVLWRRSTGEGWKLWCGTDATVANVWLVDQYRNDDRRASNFCSRLISGEFSGPQEFVTQFVRSTYPSMVPTTAPMLQVPLKTPIDGAEAAVVHFVQALHDGDRASMEKFFFAANDSTRRLPIAESNRIVAVIRLDKLLRDRFGPAGDELLWQKNVHLVAEELGWGSVTENGEHAIDTLEDGSTHKLDRKNGEWQLDITPADGDSLHLAYDLEQTNRRLAILEKGVEVHSINSIGEADAILEGGN